MTNQVRVKVKNVSKQYGQGRTAVQALQDVNLTVGCGEFVLVVGPSGSGKTTLLSIIGCILRPTQGCVYINGRDISDLKDQQLALIRRREIGFVFQSFNLMPALTAQENVQIPMQLNGYKGAVARRRAGELLDAVRLADRRKFLAVQLSGGEKQRVSIARALANEPDILLADEPTGNLDSRVGGEVLRLFQKLATEQNKTVIIVTHDTRMQSLAQRVIVIEDGRLRELADPSQPVHWKAFAVGTENP